MRIVSLLPSGTEIVAALGLLDQLIGVSHECDYPAAVNAIPRVLKCPIHNAGLTSAEIDAHVQESTRSGRSLYEIDVPLLTQLEPDIVLTQMLCDVCAIGYGTVAGLVATLPKRPQLLNLAPRCLDDLYADIRQVADATQSGPHGETVIKALQGRIESVTSAVADVRRPRVLFLEWIDPPFAPGHWTPELIELAGGECAIGTTGARSVRIDWNDVVASRPDIIIIACCGFGVERIKEDLPILTSKPGWQELPAVRTGSVYLIDGSQYFNRSGPRLIDSLEILAAIFHPDSFPARPTVNAAVRLDEIPGAREAATP